MPRKRLPQFAPGLVFQPGSHADLIDRGRVERAGWRKDIGAGVEPAPDALHRRANGERLGLRALIRRGDQRDDGVIKVNGDLIRER